MENFTCCMEKFVKVPCSSQNFMHIKIYMHHVKTCKKCQTTYKNMYATLARETNKSTKFQRNKDEVEAGS